MKTLYYIFLSLFLFGFFIFPSCKKESLKTATISEPALYVRGNLNGDTINFTAGLQSITASTYNIEVDTFRFFTFIFERKDNWSIPSFEFRFNNYKSPYSSIENDLVKTFKIGNYFYTEQGNPTSNPFQFSRVTITYIDSMSYIYTSRNIYHDLGDFSIYKIENYITNDNEKFLKVFIHFNCILNNSKSTLELKNAEAVIAFEYI